MLVCRLPVKISMRAGEHMTYHMHNYREEVWTVVSGKGKAIVDGMEQVLRTGDVITIAAGCKHTVEAITALDMIEVQLGDEISVADKIKFPIRNADMKILLVNTYYYPEIYGGAEYSVKKLAEELKQQGHTVKVLCTGSERFNYHAR